MSEDPAQKAAKYLATTQDALKHLRTKHQGTISEDYVNRILELVKGYTKDAKHYAEKKRPVTSLTCIAYAEGLLDALKFLELIEL